MVSKNVLEMTNSPMENDGHYQISWKCKLNNINANCVQNLLNYSKMGKTWK